MKSYLAFKMLFAGVFGLLKFVFMLVFLYFYKALTRFHMMSRFINVLFCCLLCSSLMTSTSDAQQADSAVIKQFFNSELASGSSYGNLEKLCKGVGNRLSGSANAEKAVLWAQKTMTELHPDTVYLQEVMVPHWVRGKTEKASIEVNGQAPIAVSILALGGSIATPAEGLVAQVIEIHALSELELLGDKVKGKIVFFNRPMDPQEILVFDAYGKAVDQRWAGPSEAAKFGAVGSICRSMTTATDDFPHTGAMKYKDSIPQIPCCAISTLGADRLSAMLKKNADLMFRFTQSCSKLPDVKSYNVVAEIRGSLHPDRFIVAGGHLDSWDLGEGAHDDGAGVVQSMEIIRLFRDVGIRPKNTIRIVAFMNEENGLKGGRKYAELAKNKNEKHLCAIETDAGAFSPRGLSMDGNDTLRSLIRSWKPLLEPYGLYDFEREGGGADISPLKDQQVPVFELMPDSQRYFNYHHTNKDVFEAIDRRELELCAAAMASLVYLLDQYDWK